MCPKTCPGFRAETRKSLSYLEAPVGIEPTNRGFAVDREPLRRTLSCSIPLHKPLSQNWTLPKRSRSRVEHKASLQILRIPRQDSILEIDLMGTLFDAVALPGIDYHFGLNAERFQSPRHGRVAVGVPAATMGS